MRRRWIIRVPLMLLLLLCLAEWRRSYTCFEQFDYALHAGTSSITAQIGFGKLVLMPTNSGVPVRAGLRYIYRDFLIYDDIFDVPMPGDMRFWGFHLFFSRLGWLVQIPFWFPTSVSAALLLLFWRKRGVKQRGFPAITGNAPAG